MSRIYVQQHKVLATAVEAVGGQVYLLRRRQMDETNTGQRLGSKLAFGLGGRPLVAGAQMQHHRRRLSHKRHFAPTAERPGVRNDTAGKPAVKTAKSVGI